MELSRLCHFCHHTDTPEDYWCKVPELENFTVAQRKFLAIPLIDVSNYDLKLEHDELSTYLKREEEEEEKFINLYFNDLH